MVRENNQIKSADGEADVFADSIDFGNDGLDADYKQWKFSHDATFVRDEIVESDGDIIVIGDPYQPVTRMIFENDSGEVGRLEWGGDKMEFTGNIDESAKDFFDHIIGMYSPIDNLARKVLGDMNRPISGETIKNIKALKTILGVS